MKDLNGQVAIVTGGGSGIGRAVALALATAGVKVVVCGRRRAPLEQTVAAIQAKSGEALAVQADIAQAEDVSQVVDTAVQRFATVDILINNAGIGIRKQPQDYELAEWHQVMDTNLTSAFTCSQAVYPEMCRRGGGKIINIGSMLSIFGASFSAPYAASKGGIVQLAKSLANAWARDNIQVNTILPGWINTELTIQARKDVEGLHERILARTPAGRWGEPDDHAGIAVFLASAASDFITGASIPVDGGFSVNI